MASHLLQRPKELNVLQQFHDRLNSAIVDPNVFSSHLISNGFVTQQTANNKMPLGIPDYQKVGNLLGVVDSHIKSARVSGYERLKEKFNTFLSILLELGLSDIATQMEKQCYGKQTATVIQPTEPQHQMPAAVVSTGDNEIMTPAVKKLKAETGSSVSSIPSNIATDSGEIIGDKTTAQNEAIASSAENIPFHWCSFTGQQDLPVQPIATGSNGAYPAVLPHGVILWKKHQITVAFTNKTIGFLDDWGLKVDDILEWANRWHELQEEPKYIPRFIGHPSQSVKGADIIVELNEKGRNESLPGNAGKAGSTKPTMWLDLSHKDHNYNEYLVVHEFGHALGLGHEHQRSDFRACIISFLDETKMSKKLQGRYKDWSTDVKLDINRATEYDPESVMHYWFEKEWLKYGFDDKNNIEAYFKAGILSEKMKNALLGVHSCSGALPTKPSARDLQFVNGVYEKIFNKPEP